MPEAGAIHNPRNINAHKMAPISGTAPGCRSSGNSFQKDNWSRLCEGKKGGGARWVGSGARGASEDGRNSGRSGAGHMRTGEVLQCMGLHWVSPNLRHRVFHLLTVTGRIGIVVIKQDVSLNDHHDLQT